MGWVGVVTNAGNAMLAQLAGGDHTLTITDATIGTGTRPEINLRTATALVSEVGEIGIVEKKEIADGVRIRTRVGPAASTGYTAHEIGLWGKIDNGARTLFSIHQDSGAGVDIPTQAASPGFVFDLIVGIAVSNADSFSVTIDPAVYATISDIEGKLDEDQGIENAGKFLMVGVDGIVTVAVVDMSGKLDSTAAAPAYDATATYAVGDKCSFNGKIYRCTTAITEAEAWNSTHWTVDDSLVEQIGAKADKDQGSVNAGKFMKVGNDGNMAPADLPDGSTSGKGVVQLEDSHTSTSTTKAATPKNVKEAYDLANGKAAPATVQTVTAASGSWSSATPPTQTISVTGVTASNNIIVGIGSGITAAQYEAACNAKIVCTAQGAGTITLTCYGDVPTENIPITVIILG